MQFDEFVAGRLSANQFDLVARAIKMTSEQAQESLVRGGVHGWRSYFDAEFAADWLADLVHGSVWLQFNRKKHPGGVLAKKGWSLHFRLRIMNAGRIS